MLLDMEIDAVTSDKVVLKDTNMAQVDDKCVVSTEKEISEQNGFSANVNSVLDDIEKMNNGNIDDIEDIDALLSPKNDDQNELDDLIIISSKLQEDPKDLQVAECEPKESLIELNGVVEETVEKMHVESSDKPKETDISNTLMEIDQIFGENSVVQNHTEDKVTEINESLDTEIAPVIKTVENGNSVMEESLDAEVALVEESSKVEEKSLDKDMEVEDAAINKDLNVEDVIPNSDRLLAILDAQDDVKTSSPLCKDAMVEIPNPDLNFSDLDKSLEKEKDVNDKTEDVIAPNLENEKRKSFIIDTVDLIMSDDEHKDADPIVTQTSKVDTDVVISDCSDKNNEKAESSVINAVANLPQVVANESSSGITRKEVNKKVQSSGIKKDKRTPAESPANLDVGKSDPIIPLNFMKTFKSQIGEMTRGDLEEFCLVKICEAIRKRSNLNEVEERLKSQNSHIDLLRKTLTVVTKQNRDLEIVMKNLENEHKKRLKDIIEPVKITRSVGFQVGVSTLRGRNVRPNTVPEVSNAGQNKPPVKNTAATTTPKTPILDNVTIKKKVSGTPVTSKKSDVSAKKADGSAKKTDINVKKLDNTTKKMDANTKKVDVNPKKPIDIKPPVNQKNNNVKNIPIATKPKQTAEKRPLDSSIDLTDDEPPSKQIAANNRNKPSPQVKGPNNANNNFFVLNQQQNNKKFATIRPRLNNPINNLQGPPPLRPLDSNVLTNNKVGIPIKGTNNNQPGPARRQYKHPAPLPPVEHNPRFWIRPQLKLSRVQTGGIVVSWVMEAGKEFSHHDIAWYQIFAYQENCTPPSTDTWKKIGDVGSMPLPMACTLTQFLPGFRYYFAIRGVDHHSNPGPFSAPAYVSLTDK